MYVPCEIVVGPDTATVRPGDGVYWRVAVTWELPENPAREFRPLTVTAVEPLPPPNTTSTWLPAEVTDAAPSRQPEGTVVTMVPVIPAYQVYSQ